MPDNDREPPLHDLEKSLREIARNRLKRDTLTRGQVQLGDGLAEYLHRHFAAEEAETAGRAVLTAASAVASLITEGVERPEIVVNILAFAAARMIIDGRAWDEAHQEATHG